MEHEEHQLAERLEQAATLLERTLTWLEEHQTALTGEVEKISATVDAAAFAREEELAAKLAAAESEISELKAAASAQANTASSAMLTSTRKTVPASTADMLAKRGIGDGPVDVRALDAALSGLTLEQRIAVKSQLLRAGSIA
jgi:F0F1-type ATP synthase membrane subunit b/b'